MIDYKLLERMSKISLSDIHLNRYNKLITLAIDGIFENYDYYELHHYLPRSLFPEFINDSNNIIRVPGKLHYILHYLLTKITKTPQMIMAFNQMNRIKCKSKRSGRLYSNCRMKFAEIQKKRRHFYNRITREHIFSMDEKPFGWIKGMPEEFNCGKHDSFNWIYNSETKEHKRISADVEIPNGFIKGRISGVLNGLIKMNSGNRFYSLIQKRIVYSELRELGYCNDPGKSVIEVYKFNSRVTISKKYIFNFLFNVRNDSLDKKNPHEFIIPQKHFNMNKDWYYFCEKNQGKKMKEIGLEIIPLTEFIYNNEECI